MASEVIGREGESELILAFLDAGAADSPRALVLEGEAGIGKSTLWVRGLELARERGFRVLASRPAEPERDLALAGLGDIFEDVLEDVLPALSPPRRHALEVALLLQDAPDPLAPRALAVAVRSALELLAAAQPLVLAVDDVQWFDDSSADALAFALRRTRAPIHVLLARRLAMPAGSTRLESALPEPSVQLLHVGPLSAGALQAVVRERLDRVFPRPTLFRILEMSGGNPFYGLEIARALPHELEQSLPLPVPETLEELVRARIDGVPEPSREALVLLSAMGEGDEKTLRAAGIGNALDGAVSSGIIERAAGRLRFAHPLLASSVYQGADDATRRSCHALLAELVRDPLESARHLALAADGPDAAIAAALDDAATAANFRGVPNVAAELGELARQLTPVDDHEGRHRRAIVGATTHLRVADARRARALADETLAEAGDDPSRAEALVLMSSVEALAANHEAARDLRREALSCAAGHPALQAAVHQWLAANLDSEGIHVQERHARASLELAERVADDFLRAGALAVLADLRLRMGDPDAVALAEEACALAAAQATRDADRVYPGSKLAHLLAWTYDRLDLVASFVLADILGTIGRFDGARALLDRLEAEVGRQDELLLAKTLWMRGSLELQARHWSLAHDLFERERELEALYETTYDWPHPYLDRAELALHRGELDDARELAAHGRRLAVSRQQDEAHAEAVLGLVEHAAGEPDAAIASFTAAEAVASAYGWREPALLWWRADFAEALLEVGRIEEAVALLDAWEPDARRLGRDREVAYLTRCRGLVAAARGDVDLALETLERAVGEADAVPDSFARARALLALGVARRRARQKRGAQEAIAGALAGFEALGEVPWAERARAELGRLGGRKRAQDLTPAERRVAALVAEGRTNREVAAALFLSERTVETHLTRTYAKLGIRSRTELARAYEPAS